MVEELTGKGPRLLTRNTLTGGQPGRRLDHTVETPTACPRTSVTPGVNDNNHRSWVTFSNLLR